MYRSRETREMASVGAQGVLLHIFLDGYLRTLHIEGIHLQYHASLYTQKHTAFCFHTNYNELFFFSGLYFLFMVQCLLVYSSNLLVTPSVVLFIFCVYRVGVSIFECA